MPSKAVKENALFEGDSDLKVRVDIDKNSKTITITANGIGMNCDEIVSNLGMIAKSGTAEFLYKLEDPATYA